MEAHPDPHAGEVRWFSRRRPPGGPPSRSGRNEEDRGPTPRTRSVAGRNPIVFVASLAGRQNGPVSFWLA
jgi:hypothetical protein